MELIEGVALSKLCDYSFGDQSGQWGNIYTSFMKDANFLIQSLQLKYLR